LGLLQIALFSQAALTFSVCQMFINNKTFIYGIFEEEYELLLELNEMYDVRVCNESIQELSKSSLRIE